MKTVYRIRRTNDGLFSTGGAMPRFKKSGKTWSTRSALSNHLACVRDYNYSPGVYIGCEIQEISITESNTRLYPVSNWTTQLEQRRRDRERAEAVAKIVREREERYNQYLALKKEFEPALQIAVPAPNVSDQELDRDCLNLIREGLVVGAIKHYRTVRGVSLREAHDHVQRLRDKA